MGMAVTTGQRKRPRGKPPRNWRVLFLRALAREPNVSAASRVAHVGRDTAMAHRARDPEFAKKWAAALEAGGEALEHEMWRRATKGVRRGVWMKDAKGKPTRVDSVTQYSDVLAIVMAKGIFPQKYRDNQQVEHVGPGGGAVQVVAIGVTAAELPQPKQAQPALDVPAQAKLLEGNCAAANGEPDAEEGEPL